MSTLLVYTLAQTTDDVSWSSLFSAAESLLGAEMAAAYLASLGISPKQFTAPLLPTFLRRGPRVGVDVPPHLAAAGKARANPRARGVRREHRAALVAALPPAD